MDEHSRHAGALTKLGISALSMAHEVDHDDWVFLDKLIGRDGSRSRKRTSSDEVHGAAPAPSR
jgi:hypothetical protein